MTETDTIMVVDDEPGNIRLLGEILVAEGYQVIVARSGEEALARIENTLPTVLLLDVVMPGLSGYDVCQRLRANPKTAGLPIILVTGARPEEERVRGLDAGADEFLTKPVNREELLARLRSLLRVQQLHRQIAEWNEKLEERVQQQMNEMRRLEQLKNFLPARVAEMAVQEGGESMLEPRRQMITSLVLDMRGFTAFTEAAEPEDVIQVLAEYYASMGEIVERFGGTVDRFAGDGMVVLFNAPINLDKHEQQAVLAALELQSAYAELRSKWLSRGFDLGLGIGLSSGHATIGALGFSGRWQYTAIGTVINLAARLCSDAAHGEILAAEWVIKALDEQIDSEAQGERSIRGLKQPVVVHRIRGLLAETN